MAPFFPPRRSTLQVARESGLRGPRVFLLSTLAGRFGWAAYIRRRVPVRLAKHWLRVGHSADPRSTVVRSDGPRHFRGGLLVSVGPGEAGALRELIETLRHYEGHDIKVVVADDLTDEYPEKRVREEFPGIDFVQPRVPSGTGSCAFRTLRTGLTHMLSNYELPTILKADTDALVIAPGAFQLATERFEADRSVGILGTTSRSASGRATDYRWGSWMAHPELRWSRRFRTLVSQATSATGQLGFAQGGAYFLSAVAARTALEQKLLSYRQPQWSLQSDDVIMDLVVQAAGFRVDSFGAPGDPIASDTNSLPIEPQELLDGGFRVVHSVRASPSGMREEEVRTFFKETRQQM